MAEVGINHLERTEGASVKEVSIGGKTLKSLQTIPKFQIKSDIDLFLDNIKNLPEFGGVAFDLWSIPSIYQSITLSGGQRNLYDLAKPRVTEHLNIILTISSSILIYGIGEF